MISFKESLEFKKTEKLALECFREMIIRGISPEAFVEWLDTHSETDHIADKAEKWIVTELKVNEQGFFQNVGNFMQGAANKVQGAVGSFMQNAGNKMMAGSGSNQDPLVVASNQAVEKINDLIKKSNRQNSRLAQKDIQDSLYGILKTLKNTPVATQPPPIPPQAGAKPMKPMAGGPPTVDAASKARAAGAATDRASSPDQFNYESSRHGKINPIEIKLMEARIKSLCFLIEGRGFNSKLFAQWIANEYVLDEANWLGGAWAGLKGGLAGGFDRFMGGGEGSVWDAFTKGYKGSRDEKYDQYDMKSIEDAIKHLTDFSGKLDAANYKELSKQIADLSANLRNVATSKAPAESGAKPAGEAPPAEAGETPPTDPAAEPTPEEFLKNYPEKTTKGNISVVGSIRKLPKDIQEKIMKTKEFQMVMKNPKVLNNIRDLSKIIKTMVPPSP